MLCNLLKVQSAPDADMESFDSNALKYHYFMVLFRKVVEGKIEDPRGKLTRFIKYTARDARDLIKNCIQLPSNEGFAQIKYLLEKTYGKPHRILASYIKEVKIGQRSSLETQRDLENSIAFCSSAGVLQLIRDGTLYTHLIYYV